MRCKIISYLCAIGLALLPRPVFAQDPVLDESIRREIQDRLSQYLDNMQRIRDLCTARLPVSPDVRCAGTPTSRFINTKSPRTKA